ncbi:MAG: 50S ribosomal protein L11 methyltransferase [Clostridia bacterium]|nr:50S ribosomal protein L11 methyltransferase [Clostridia bacterium]
MKFTEVTIHTTTEGSELVADVLWRYTVYGVAISDVADVIALQQNKVMYWDYMDESLTDQSANKEVLVKSFIALDETDTILPEIREDIEELGRSCVGNLYPGSLEITLREVEGDEWHAIWKEHFRPIHIGADVVVVPEWIRYDRKPGEKVVYLDSNMAFGTGEHETTSMCLELMQDYIKPKTVCIDVGCGSGILGIAAIKLGAKHAYLTDIDKVAVESAAHNAKLNCVQDNVDIVQTNLIDGFDVQGDLVVANITAEILCGLASAIPKCLNKGGTLILSGIIEDRVDMVLEFFLPQGLELVKRRQKGGWIALVFKSV